ncbi:hypothetical protein TNCV_978291 [Trichonephila clavipes]|nr:hypothetical protein TNCV_978291 [Trichonephila clavipes]
MTLKIRRVERPMHVKSVVAQSHFDGEGGASSYVVLMLLYRLKHLSTSFCIDLKKHIITCPYLLSKTSSAMSNRTVDRLSKNYIKVAIESVTGAIGDGSRNLSPGQMTRTTPELALIYLTSTPLHCITSTGGRLGLDRFNVYFTPLHGGSSAVLGLNS